MKTKIIAIAASLSSLSSFGQYGAEHITHSTSFLSSAKLCVTSYGYVTAGVYANATSSQNDFVIDQLDPITNLPLFQYDFKIATTCSSSLPHDCEAVDIIETYVSSPSLSYAFVGTCADGIFFGTLDNTGALIDKHFWGTTSGTLLKHPVIRESSTSGTYWISCNVGNQAFVAKYTRGAASPIWEYIYSGNYILDPRDIIEDPSNSNNVVVVGLVDLGNFWADDAFFLQISASNGAVNIFNTYCDYAYSGDEWFNKIEPALCTSSGGPGYIIGGRQHPGSSPNVVYSDGWVLKVDYSGNVLWSTIFQSGEVLDICERPDGNNSPVTYEYFALTQETIAGNNVLVQYHFDSNGSSYSGAATNRYEFAIGTNGLSGATDFTRPQLVISGDGTGLYDGLGTFGTNISSSSGMKHAIIGSYFNGIMGCDNQTTFTPFAGPGYNYSPFMSGNISNLSCNGLTISRTTNTDPLAGDCSWGSSVLFGSNAKAAPTGITQASMQEIQYSISPNPSNGAIRLTLTSATEELTFSIKNQLGQIVFQQHFAAEKVAGELNFDLAKYHLASGVYFTEIKTPKGISTQKLIYTE